MKNCSKCKIDKEDSEFRVRVEKRTTPHLSYLNNTCKLCDKEAAAIYYKNNKNDTRFKEKNKKRSNRYRIENLDKVLIYEKNRKLNNKWRAYMHEYKMKNKERIAELSLLRNRRYSCDIIEQIKPAYIVRLLSHPREGISASTIRQYDELIQTYQTFIAIKRFLTTKNNKQWTISYNSERLC